MIRIPIKQPNWEAMVFSDETEALAMSFGPAIQLCVGSSRDTTFTSVAIHIMVQVCFNFWNEMVHTVYTYIYMY